MTKEEWELLETFYEFDARGHLNQEGKDYLKYLFEKTREADEHPEGFDWGCLCQLCCSYGD